MTAKSVNEIVEELSVCFSRYLVQDELGKERIDLNVRLKTALNDWLELDSKFSCPHCGANDWEYNSDDHDDLYTYDKCNKCGKQFQLYYKLFKIEEL